MNSGQRSVISDKIDFIILILLTIQIAVVSISIAVSSIAFGAWAGLWLIQFFIFKKDSFLYINSENLKAINFFILAYAFFEILSRFFAVYPEGAFSNLKRLLLFLIFYVSIVKVINFKALIVILLINITAVSAVSVIEITKYSLKFGEMINQMPFSEIRIDYFNYPLTSGEIKMMSLLSVFPLLFIKEKFLLHRRTLLLILLPVITSMLLTQSRNVLVALTICFIIFGIAANRKFLYSFLLIIIAAGVILPSQYTDRAKSIIDPGHLSNKSRLNMWSVGIQMFKDHPFTGVADSHIREIYETYRTPEEQSEGVHLHNNFIMILATTGIFGIISFLGIFITVFLKQIKFLRNEKDNLRRMLIFGSILVMISFQVSGIFEWSFGDHEVVTVFFFLTAVPFILNNISNNKINTFSSDQ
ncbi:MAG: O-antigen ligase family protein [Bacteroidetes bacterium]|nr:O-antigen ligase family protein [Bacteroidota bacterium]